MISSTQTAGNRIAFYTFGCRLNQSETSVLRRNFEASGYQVVDFHDRPHIVVINTCTVTENGDADTYRLVKKIRHLNPQVCIALIGCQAQIQKEKLAHLPNVQWIVGNAHKMELLTIIEETKEATKPQIVTPTIQKTDFTIPSAAIDRIDPLHTRANLKIQDGCDFFCSFCEIPYARGRARSRIFEDILLEAEALVAVGHKEIVLTGVNLGTYQCENKTIVDIIDRFEDIEGLKRIRISSIEPTTIPWALIERMGKTKLCRHLHIPLQSGSDEILLTMKRKYKTHDFANFIYRVYRVIPQIAIGTDIIVGFPGETERHFNETLRFLRELPFSYFHVFSYSDRSYNKSRHYNNKIPPEVIDERSQILRELSLRKKQLFMRDLVGSTQDVLFEQNKNGVWSGLTDNYVRIYAESPNNIYNELYPVLLKKVIQSRIEGILL